MFSTGPFFLTFFFFLLVFVCRCGRNLRSVLGSGLGPSVESACDSASSSCSADQICRDVVPMTGPTHPTEETASSSGSGKQVQSKLKSQDKQNHCGSGGEAGTGAGAGSDTLGRRKKRKKKRKSRPRDPLIPWVQFHHPQTSSTPHQTPILMKILARFLL